SFGGSYNVVLGYLANSHLTTNTGNTLVGAESSTSGNLTNAGAIGYKAFVGQNDSLVLGSINGVNSATADTKVGIGTTTPGERLHVVGNGLVTGSLSSNIVNATTQYNIGGNRILGI